MSVHTIQDMITAYSQEAVVYARQNFGETLDFSEKSVEKVENILDDIYRTIPRGFIAKLLKKSPSAEQMDHICMMMGGYIGEVIRRNWGGEWKLESSAYPGEQVLTLHLLRKDSELWPQFKVGKRLANGAEDNVWRYFQVLKRIYFEQQ